MLCPRSFASLIAVLCLSAPVAAENLLDRTNCIGVVREFEIGSSSTRAEHDLESAPIILEVPHENQHYIFNTDDPIALVEEWSESGPLVSHKIDQLASDGGSVLNCAEIIVEFRVGERSSSGEKGVSVKARSLEGPNENSTLRILLLDLVDSHTQANSRFDEWHIENYRIAVRFDRISNDETLLKPSTFSGPLQFFPDGARRDSDHVLSVPLDRESPYVVAKDGTPLIPAVVVLCGQPCSEIYGAVQKNAGAHISPNPDRQISVSPAVSDNPVREIQEIVETSPYFRFTTDVAGRNASGGYFTDGFEAVESLACLIEATAPGTGIFFNPPDCSGQLINHIRERHSEFSIRITDDGQWILGTHVPDSPLEKVTITLPDGVNGSTCRMQVNIETEGGSETVQLEFVSRSNPVAYSARIAPPVKPTGGQIAFRIQPSNSADCGGDARRVVTDASSEITIPLLDGGAAKSAVAFVFVPDLGATELELGATGVTTRALAEGLIQVALSAHHRMALTNPGAIFALQQSSGLVLSQSGLKELFSLNADQLRSSNVASRNLEKEVEILSRNRFPFSQVGLLRGVEEVALEARTAGFDKVDFFVVGSIMRNESAVPAKPCAPATFDVIRTGLMEIDDIELRVQLLPIVKLDPGQVPDFSAQHPLTFSANATGQPGGLFRCKVGVKEPIAVYPFYVESWRETHDAIPRLTAAMTDQAAALLQEYVK